MNEQSTEEQRCTCTTADENNCPIHGFLSNDELEVERLRRGVEEICRLRMTPPATRARLRHLVAGVDWRKARE